MRDNPAYGHERIALELGLNKEKVRRIMKAYGLQPTIRRVKPWTKSKTEDDTAGADVLNLIRDTKAEQLSHIWASDFTYLWFEGKWYYLATVLDLF